MSFRTWRRDAGEVSGQLASSSQQQDRVMPAFLWLGSWLIADLVCWCGQVGEGSGFDISDSLALNIVCV